MQYPTSSQHGKSMEQTDDASDEANSAHGDEGLA